MATPTIVTDLQTITDAESETNWAIINDGKLTLNDDFFIEGAASVGNIIDSTGDRGLWYDRGAGLNLTGKYLYIWQNTVCPIKTEALNGIRVRVGDTAGNWGEWTVGGSDTYAGGWQLYVVQVDMTYDFSSATPADRTILDKFGIMVRNLTTQKFVPSLNIDVIRYGTYYNVRGGTAVDPVTFENILVADESDRYGVVHKVNEAYYLAGSLLIGSGGTTTYFADSGNIVAFYDNRVNNRFYKIQCSGDNTTLQFGNVIGSGSTSIGTRGSYVKSNGSRFNLNIRNTGVNVKLYGTTFDHASGVELGRQGVYLGGDNVDIVDCTFYDTYAVQHAITGIPLELRNTLSFNGDSKAYTVYDINNISGTSWSLVQSSGFSSINDSITRTYNLYDIDFTTALNYITVYPYKTWNVIDGANFIVDTGTQDQLYFTADNNNQVNERYSVNTATKTAAGVVIPSSVVYVYEGLNNQNIETSGQANAQGEFSSSFVRNNFTYLSATTLDVIADGDHAVKVYKYGRSPFVAAIDSSESYNATVTLITDAGITAGDEATAIANGAGITVSRHGNGEIDSQPLNVIHFDTGNNTLTEGEIVRGQTSKATGVAYELLGDSSAGIIALSGWNGALFANGETIDNSPSAGSWTAIADISDGAQSFQEQYTWLVDCNSLSMSATYDYLAARMAQNPLQTGVGYRFLDVLLWGEDEQSQLLYVGADGYYTERNINRGEGVWIGNRAAGTIDYMTSDSGNIYSPPAQYTFTLTNLIANSEVRMYDIDTAAEINGTESSTTTFSHSYIYAGSDIDFYVNILHIDYQWLQIDGLTLSNSDQSIPVQQIPDRNYDNP